MIDNEIAAGLKNLRGSLSMARRAEPDTNGSQFFICFKPQPFLDGKYTVFGKVIDGLPVLDKIEEIGTVGEGRPKETVTFNIEVVSKRNHEYVVKKNNKH